MTNIPNRTATVYLCLRPGRWSSDLHVRVTTRAPKLAADEVAMSLNLDVPGALFKRPALSATVKVPAESVNRPQIDAAVVDNIRTELQRTLGVDLTVAVIEPDGDA